MRNLINKRYVYQFFDYSMEIQIFSNSKFGQLRVALNENGETVFCLADVCKALGIVEPSRVKERLDSSNLHSVKVSTKLPQIRKTGGYIPVSAEDDEKSILAKALNIMQRTLEDKDRLIEEQRPMAKLSVTPMITGKGQQHFLNLFCGEK